VSDLLRILALSGLAKNGISEVNEGTEMGQIGNVHIKQFGMGKGNLGIQLTGDDGYVQLNREEAAQLAARLAKWAGSKDMALPGEYESVDSDDENFIEGRNDGPRSECCDAPLANYENGLGICTDCRDHAAAHNEDELDETQVTENKMSEQRDAEKEQYLATMRETTKKLKDELINEMMGD
jgi:hypothetical protein